MRVVAIDRTDLLVSRWSYGTGSLHHVFSSAARRKLLDVAAATGFSHFDTSPYYGHGLSETDLGKFLQHQRGQFTVATKVGLYSKCPPATSALGVWARKGAERIWRSWAAPKLDWRVSEAMRSLDESLTRLRTDYVDLLFLHEPDPKLAATEEMHRWLEDELRRGRVRNWGLAGAQVAGMEMVTINHPLAQVLQIKDSLKGREADVLSNLERPIQFSYGYFAGLSSDEIGMEPDYLLKKVLERNQHGSIVVSTRSHAHLRRFASTAEQL